MNQNNPENSVNPVLLEQALRITGFGLYNYLLICVSGLTLFSGLGVLLTVSYILPATGCNWKLSTDQKGVLTSMGFTGLIFSSHLYGYLSDRYGRKKIMLWSNLQYGFLALIAMFAPNYITLTIFWFLAGFIASGLLSPTFVYLSEFCSSESRASSLLIASAIGALITTCLPALAWLVIPLKIHYSFGYGFEFNSWRLYIGLTSIIPFISAFLLITLHESPKYLIIKGKNQEALKAIQTLYLINNKNPEEFKITNVTLDEEDLQAASLEKSGGFISNMVSQTIVLFSPKLLKCTLLSCILQLGLIGSYNIMMLWLNEIINRISIYNSNVEVYNATICQVFKYKEKVAIVLSKAIENVPAITYEIETGNKEEECLATINEYIYVASGSIGLLQFFVCCFVSKISLSVRRKVLIVMCTLFGSLSYFALMQFKTMLLTLMCFAAVAASLGAALPLAVAIVVDFFPTNLRGMATCICMIAGRVGSAFGGRIFGILQEHYCEYSYYGLAIILLGVALLCIFLPIGKK